MKTDWSHTTYTDSRGGPKSTDLKPDSAVMAVYYFCVVLAIWSFWNDNDR